MPSDHHPASFIPFIAAISTSVFIIRFSRLLKSCVLSSHPREAGDLRLSAPCCQAPHQQGPALCQHTGVRRKALLGWPVTALVGSPGQVQAKCKVLPFVVFGGAAFVALTASEWDFWEAFAALGEGNTAPFKLSVSCGGFGSDELSSQSKRAKQPVLFLEQKYRWAAGKQASANTALIAVRPENNDSSQVLSTRKADYESLA